MASTPWIWNTGGKGRLLCALSGWRGDCPFDEQSLLILLRRDSHFPAEGPVEGGIVVKARLFAGLPGGEALLQTALCAGDFFGQDILVQSEAGDLLEAPVQIDAVMMHVPGKLLYGERILKVRFNIGKELRHKGGHDAWARTGRRGHMLVEHDKDQPEERDGEDVVSPFSGRKDGLQIPGKTGKAFDLRVAQAHQVQHGRRHAEKEGGQIGPAAV